MSNIPKQLYRIRDVLERTGLSKSSLYDLLNTKSPRHDPTAPRPFALGARSRAFLAEEVDAWIAAKAAHRL